MSVPTASEVEKTLGKVARGLIECAKHFVRWMDGTCIECPPIKVSEDDEDEPFVHSFFSDVSASSSVVKAVLSLSQYAHRAMMSANRWGCTPVQSLHPKKAGDLKQVLCKSSIPMLQLHVNVKYFLQSVKYCRPDRGYILLTPSVVGASLSFSIHLSWPITSE